MTHNAAAIHLNVAASRPRLDWGTPLSLVLLGVVPALGGAMRLASYVPNAAALPDESRFADVRWLLVAHIVGVLTFALVGAFQFSRMLRGRKPGVHRLLGRVAAVGGLVGGVAGTAGLFVFSPHPEGSPLLTVIRVAAGVATVLFLVRGWRSALRRDFVVHGRWMMRAYALGAAAGTQAVFLVPITLVQGPSSTGFALGMTLGFVVNIGVVEWRLFRTSANGARALTVGAAR